MKRYFKEVEFEETVPRPSGIDKVADAPWLLVGRYGSDDTMNITGPEKNMEYILKSQAASIDVLCEVGFVPPDERDELVKKASLEYVKPARVREIEAQTHHDIIAINTAWEEQVYSAAGSHIGKTRASADPTETQWALQAKDFVENYCYSLENLRDIILEKSVQKEWLNTPHIDKSHGFDALPTVAGRPFAFYAESLQDGIDIIEFYYNKSIKGKWADATGCHHSAKSSGLNGINNQKEYCKKLGISCMIAPAQINSREFHSDIIYAITRTQGTIANLAHYVKQQRDQDCLTMRVPRKRKGSSSMPHKDLMGGNTIKEEQARSSFKLAKGCLTISVDSIVFDWARDLDNSSSDRIIFDAIYKMSDHTARRMAGAVHELILIPDRCRERVGRTYGVTTAENVMNYLTDPGKTSNPLGRKEAHELASHLAQEAFDEKIQYRDKCLNEEEITSRFDEETITKITDPFQYIGESQKQIEMVFRKFHGKTSLPSENYQKRAGARKVT